MSFLATAIVTGVGAIGGSLISSSATKSAQKKGAAIQMSGLDRLSLAEDDLLGGDAYKSFTDFLTSFAQNPTTFTPEVVAGMKARAGDAAQSGAQNQSRQLWERAGATGSYRDGSVREGEAQIAQRLGGNLADINRGIDERAALQRPADVAQLGALLQGLFNLRMGPSQAYANVAAGVGSNVAGYNASPFGDALKGIGALGMGLGSAQQPYKFNEQGQIIGGGGTGFGNLFGN